MVTPIITKPERPTFLVDLDGTLKTHHNIEVGDLVFIRGNDDEHRFQKRPGSDAFLKKLKSVGRVVLCTAAGHDYAIGCLNLMGLLDYFDDVISSESYQYGLRVNGAYVLIDDSIDLARAKVWCVNQTQWINGFNVDDMIVLVKAYMGGHDTELQGKAAEAIAVVRRQQNIDLGKDG